MVFDSPDSGQRQRSLKHIQRDSFVKAYESILFAIYVANQLFVVAQMSDLLLLEQQSLALHPFSQDVEGVGCELSDSAESTNNKVDIPFRVAFRPFFLDCFFEFSEHEKGASVINNDSNNCSY